MTTAQLTAETFDRMIGSEGVVLVEWRASDNCAGKLAAPVFEAASHQHTDVQFAVVDTQAQPELAADVGIVSFPTLTAFRDGVRVFAMPGTLTLPILDRLIRAIRDLNMDEVRRHGPPRSNRLLTVVGCAVQQQPT